MTSQDRTGQDRSGNDRTGQPPPSLQQQERHQNG